MVPAPLQIRMYLFGLSPLLTPLVSTANVADLNAAIERARIVETGYNYIPTGGTPTAFGGHKADFEIDELSKKIEQLSLNYATLTTALTAQPAQSNTRSYRPPTPTNNTRSYRPPTPTFNRSNQRNTKREDRTCYNCNKLGHIARNCTLPRRNTRRIRFNSTTTRDVHYANFSDQEEQEEDEYPEDETDEEAEAYEQEAYPVMRSGHRYIPRTDSRRTPIVDELDQLNRNTVYNERKSQSTIVSGPNRKLKMTPAPIESVTEFDVCNYLQAQPSGLTVGQAAHLLPKYRAGMQHAVRRSYTKEKEANLLESDEEESTTAAMVIIRIKGKAQTAIVNKGAATTIMTTALLHRLGCEINRQSRVIVATANGARSKALGVASDILVTIGKIRTLTSFHVLESQDEILILGNNWLKENGAALDWRQGILTLQKEK
jgi:hypothetical protein